MSTIQIGITSIGILNGIVGEAALAGPITPLLLSAGLPEKTAAGIATGFAVVLITFFSIVLGELVPKRIGQSHPEAIARLAARPIHLMAQVTKPFVLALTSSTALLMKILGIKDAKNDTVTEDEMHAMIKETADAGLIEQHEHTMVRNVFRLDDRQIGSLMVPRSDIVTLDINNSFEDNMRIVHASDRARFPVVRGGLDDVVGVINARKWLANAISGGERELDKQNFRAPLFVPETITGMELLKNFKESGVPVAFVIDEYSAVQGIITMQDLIEAITGEFTPNDPENSWAVAREDGIWWLDGHIPVPELKDVLNLGKVPEEERGHYHTLSGMFMFMVGRLPMENDSIEWDGWKFTIIDMDGRIIDKIEARNINMTASVKTVMLLEGT
jgi:putative hemolysin